MNISNALFEFTTDLVEAETSADPLFQKKIQANLYENLEGDTIRIGDIERSEPDLVGFEIQENNAFVFVFFIALPESQTVEGLNAGRDKADEMSLYWFKKLLENPRLAKDGVNRICGIGKTKKRNYYGGTPSSKKPISELLLQINPMS